VSLADRTIAVTMGDPAGIGPEIIVKTLPDLVLSTCRIVIVGSYDIFARTAERCSVDVDLIRTQGDEPPPSGISVLDVDGVCARVEIGRPTADGGQAAWLSLRAGVAQCQTNRADCLVTAPLNKVALEAAGHGKHGHTELLQSMTDSPWALTVFVLGNTRVVFYSRHVSLRDAIDLVRADTIAITLGRIQAIAPVFGVSEPRIAVAALNPHAGEGGMFGREELDEIAPGIRQARREGVDAIGPVPADSVFHKALAGEYDFVLSLYHDQPAAVLKSVDFSGDVSVTLGLPFLRFSVDHGTAFDIAGNYVADPRNMRVAIETAAKMGSVTRAGQNRPNP